MVVLAFCDPYVTPASLKRAIAAGIEPRKILLPRKLPHVVVLVNVAHALQLCPRGPQGGPG